MAGVRVLGIAAVPNLFVTRDWFCGRQIFHQPWWGACFGRIQAHYIQAHLLLGGLVPNRPGPVLVHGPEVGDPCPTGPKLGGESNLTMYLKHVEKCVTKLKIESRGLIIEGKMDCVTKSLFPKRILIYTSEKEYLMKLRGTKIE